MQRPHWKHVLADVRANEGGSMAGASTARTRVVRGGIRGVAEGESEFDSQRVEVWWGRNQLPLVAVGGPASICDPCETETRSCL